MTRNHKLTVEDLRGRCRMVEDHWLWAGAATADGSPRIWGPDHTNGGKLSTQTGRRAMWHVKTGKPIPSGWRVFGKCDEPLCINPAHLVCRPVAEQGAHVAKSGRLKGVMRRITANRTTARKRSTLTPELIQLIRSSTKTGKQLQAETGVNRTTISRLRTGKAVAFQAVGGMFTGLIKTERGNHV